MECSGLAPLPSNQLCPEIALWKAKYELQIKITLVSSFKKQYLGFHNVNYRHDWLDGSEVKTKPNLGSTAIQSFMPINNFAELKSWVEPEVTNIINS